MENNIQYFKSQRDSIPLEILSIKLVDNDNTPNDHKFYTDDYKEPLYKIQDENKEFRIYPTKKLEEILSFNLRFDYNALFYWMILPISVFLTIPFVMFTQNKNIYELLLKENVDIISLMILLPILLFTLFKSFKKAKILLNTLRIKKYIKKNSKNYFDYERTIIKEYRSR